MTITSRPLVSVCIIAYAHQKFIAQTLEGVLAQKTIFPVEILIADDCSPDETQQIIDQYDHRLPGRMTVIRRERNVGMMPNLLDVMQRAKGRYLAICEGDDYWTDPNKLQLQVDFLEQNAEYAITFHQVQEVNEQGNLLNTFAAPANQPQSTSIEQLAKGNFLTTLSCVFRNTFWNEKTGTTILPQWLMHVSIGDYCLHMLNARAGKIWYFPQQMACFRVHSGGAWSMLGQLQRSQKLFDTLFWLRQVDFSLPVSIRLREQHLHNLKVIGEESQFVPAFDLRDFLHSRRQAVMQLLDDLYPDIVIDFLQFDQAARSAEYRWSSRMLSPIRKLVTKIRRAK